MLIPSRHNGDRRDGRRLYFLDMGGDAPPPPDYTPVAEASKEAAEVSAQLGREQLTEARRQYDQNMAVAQPVVNAQLDVMRQGLQQGADYYVYGKSFRPLEQQMSAEAAAGGVSRDILDRAKAYEAQAAADTAMVTGGDQAIADRYATDIEQDVGRAVADARAGQTQALNTAARQAARYGLAVPSNVQALSNQNAAQLAAAANTTRQGAIGRYRDLAMQGMNLKKDTFSTGQNSRVQASSLDWARKLDVTGMARGMPGASQGAYGVAVGAGDSATRNQMAPGQALMAGMGQGAGTTMQGKQIAVNGLGNILNAQTSYAGTVAKANSDKFAATMDLIGTGAGLAFSDRRLKQDIRLVGQDVRTGLNLYEFSYIHDDQRRRYLGVMADEVQSCLPEAVRQDAEGYLAVDYALLGIEFKEVA